MNCCSRCGDCFHNSRRCSVPADAPDDVKEAARKMASARWEAAWQAARAKWGESLRHGQVVEELRRLFPSLTMTKPAAQTARVNPPPAPVADVPPVEIASPRRTVVIVDGGDCPKGFTAAFKAARRGDADKWHVVAADGLGAGVRTAIALQAEHVVLCVGMEMEKSTLKPWIQRLRSIPGVQVITVYDTRMKADELDEEQDAIGSDRWQSTEGVKENLEGTIAHWKPSDVWSKPPQPWTSPLLRVAN